MLDVEKTTSFYYIDDILAMNADRARYGYGVSIMTNNRDSEVGSLHQVWNYVKQKKIFSPLCEILEFLPDKVDSFVVLSINGGIWLAFCSCIHGFMNSS